MSLVMAFKCFICDGQSSTKRVFHVEITLETLGKYLYHHRNSFLGKSALLQSFQITSNHSKAFPSISGPTVVWGPVNVFLACR